MAQKILLVDDEEGIRKVLKITLEDSGYEVLTAESGENALRLFKREKPPIVLTDIKMPGMDGIQLLQKIKEADPDTEVIMITGHGDMELAIHSLKFDAIDFITKPINAEILEIALKRAEEKISLKNQIKEHTNNLERLVEEKTEKLIEAERLAAVGQTVAGLAHAIKNITGGLTGGSFVLEKGIELKSDDYLHQGWSMLKGNLGKIKTLALDLLSFTKDREPQYSLIDPNTPVRDVAELMHAKATESGVTFRMELDETLPNVWLDPELIHRCLLNLVTNALEACTDFECPSGEKEILLRTAKSEGWAVKYQVIDTGCGMDAETQSKVFHRFFSTKGSRGTGLGLMIVKKIIDEHNGTITLQSTKGKGTAFTIRLPQKNASTQNEA